MKYLVHFPACIKVSARGNKACRRQMYLRDLAEVSKWFFISFLILFYYDSQSRMTFFFRRQGCSSDRLQGINIQWERLHLVKKCLYETSKIIHGERSNFKNCSECDSHVKLVLTDQGVRVRQCLFSKPAKDTITVQPGKTHTRSDLGR